MTDPTTRLALTRAVPPGARGARQRGHDRRTSFADFLASLSAALQPEQDPRELRLRFEEGVRHLVPLRSVALRSGPFDGRRPVQAAETISLDVPSGPVGAASIEGVIDPVAGLDEWDLQTLRSLRHVAALVIEIERSRPPFPPRRHHGSEAAPLIGSSAEISALRDRIARVAATDFAVLVEGGIDPEPHPAQG